MHKNFSGENIFSFFFDARLNVALTFNAKPESETFPATVPPNRNNSPLKPEASVDTYAEWDSWDTINAVKAALEEFNNITLVEADEDAFGKLRSIKPDMVFNIAEGFNGISREAQIPAMLEMLNIPYSGSDALTLATCLDKARTKEILSYHKIPNAPFLVADDLNFDSSHLSYPLMVKPACEGSSKGIFSSSFVNNEEELRKEVERIVAGYNQSALIEEFLPGREFTVAMLGNGNEAEALPIVEINYKDFPEDFIPIYSYEAKWILDTKENPLEVFHCPAVLTKELEEKIKRVCLDAYKVLRCRDWSRIDVRLDKNNVPNIIEINPLPGILPDPKENSCYPKAARTAGLNYNDMLNSVLFAAARRNGLL